MKDEEILRLYRERSEEAIAETQRHSRALTSLFIKTLLTA